MCLVKHLFLELPDVLKLLLVAVGDVFQSAVRVLDPLQFFVENLAVAGDATQVALDVDIFLSGPGLRVLHNLFRQSHLSGQFKGERVARKPNFQLEQRQNVLCVKHHRPVYDTSLS